MLHDVINGFLDYCRLTDFSPRSRQALTSRLNELQAFLKAERIESVHEFGYLNLVSFVADFNSPSVHIRKSRVWILKQFFHFLTLHRIVDENIASALPYPKIEKSVPQFLTRDEYNRMLGYFGEKARDLPGLRNLVMVMLIGTLGIRTATLISLEIGDVDIGCGLLWVVEKGRRQRSLILPYVLCEVIQKYLDLLGSSNGPLFISNRSKRINQRTVQDVLQKAAKSLGIDKILHPRLFRQTAATHLNRVADIDVTHQTVSPARVANRVHEGALFRIFTPKLQGKARYHLRTDRAFIRL